MTPLTSAEREELKQWLLSSAETKTPYSVYWAVDRMLRALAALEEAERRKEEVWIAGKIATSWHAEAAEAACDKLQAFKDWVHTYLDRQGVPHHPPGIHGAAGCRIGDRMDWLMERLRTAEAAALCREPYKVLLAKLKEAEADANELAELHSCLTQLGVPGTAEDHASNRIGPFVRELQSGRCE